MFKKKIVIYNKNTSFTPDALVHLADKSNAKLNLQKAAHLLRKVIFKIAKKPLPQDLNVKHIFKGECDIPENLKHFLRHLLISPKNLKENTKDIKVLSMADDVIYSVTNGSIKPSKHLKLGLTIKTLTGSKKVLTQLNRLGHCISYNIAEELETELTYSSLSTTTILPNEIRENQNSFCGLAFDN